MLILTPAQRRVISLRSRVTCQNLTQPKQVEGSMTEIKCVPLDQFENAPPPTPRLHPNLAELYRQKVMNLAAALNQEDTRLEAAECIRELIEEIRLVPKRVQLLSQPQQLSG